MQSYAKHERIPATLMLEDGSVFDGFATGTPGTTYGEIVFNTCATGYQEILTDPSYRGQIVLMTYPEIGNYGVNPEDLESASVHVSGFVTKRVSPVTSNWRAQDSLQEFLVKNGITGIEGVDTRAITRRIRTKGAMKAGITTANISAPDFLAQILAQPALDDQDLVGEVTTAKVYTLTQTPAEKVIDRLVVVDYGVKRSILTYLQELVSEIIVVPATTPLAEIQSFKPEGVLLSNGPGDPTVLTDAVRLAQDLMSANIPTFGICLGHQIIALACGAQVGKMQFGHHGGNHPVKDLESNKINITSQNHGYAVLPEAFPFDRLKVTHVNLNDKTIAGIRHLTRPVASVQFHPEASPGPHDSHYLFEQFMKEIYQHVETLDLSVR